MQTVDKNKIKRFFKSHIFRIIFCSIILFSTVFFPLVFLRPTADNEFDSLILVLIVFVCIFEITAFVLISHFFVYIKINRSSERLSRMAREGKVIKSDDKSIDGSTAVLIDAVNATADEYTRLEQVRKMFVANASHELRSPLTSVQGFLQAVLDGTVEENERDKYLNIALGETKRLNSLITSMLDLSRLDSGKNPLVLSKFNINDAVNEVIAKFEPLLINKSQQINVEFSRENCCVFADKDKIIQVITNLVDNAIKYSPAFSRIIITTVIRANKVYVTVKDYGYGISKKDQMLIWDTFYMTDKSRSPIKSKGSGLGLSIAKKIIDEHGEIIWVESNRGVGATFIFTLTLYDPSKHKITAGKLINSDGQ